MTEFIISDRQEGKTSQLIQWLKAEPDDRTRILVCMNTSERDRIREKYPDVDMNRIIVFSPFWYEGWDTSEFEIAIDNAEILLSHVLGGVNVAVVTATGMVRTLESFEGK